MVHWRVQYSRTASRPWTFARGKQMTIAGFTELLLHTDADTPMVDDDQFWLIKPIVDLYGLTHIRNLKFQTDDIGQIDMISATRIGGDTPLCADRRIAFYGGADIPAMHDKLEFRRFVVACKAVDTAHARTPKHRPLLVLGRESVR